MASIDSDSIQPVKASGFYFNLSFIILTSIYCCLVFKIFCLVSLYCYSLLTNNRLTGRLPVTTGFPFVLFFYFTQ